MYGKRSDALGLMPQKRDQGETPTNNLIGDTLKTMPWLGMQYRENPTYTELSQKKTEYMILPDQQGPISGGMIPGNEQFYKSGLVGIPQGGFWPSLFDK